MPLIGNPAATGIDTARSKFVSGSPTNARLLVIYSKTINPNLARPGYPDDITITFDNVVRDTGIVAGVAYQAKPAKFIVTAHTPQGDRRLDFRFRDFDNDGTLSRADEFFDILTFARVATRDSQATWRVALDTLGQGKRGALVKPARGDTFQLALTRPISADDAFVFTSTAQSVDPAAAKIAWSEKPYVVPNPYLGAASFEPGRFAISGRGERRIEFRAIPLGSVIRIYTVRGVLVQTLRQDGSNDGFVAWNLRTKDNLDVAPGLYVYHLEAPGVSEFVGKFAIIR